MTASVAAFAQGKVSFGNDSNHYFVIGTPWAGDAAIGGGVASTAGNTVSGTAGAIPTSPLPSGWTLIAALYAGNGTSGNNLTLATSYTLDGGNWFQAGRMTTRGIAVAGLTGGQVDTLAVVITDVQLAVGTPFTDVAPAGAHYYGSSGLFQMTPGTSLTYPSIVSGGGTTWAPANLVINAVPEPSTFALAGLGAAAMLIFRRRK